MNTYFNIMNETYAKEITNWKYDILYEIYNMSESQEDIDELLNGAYYAVLDKDSNPVLIGYFCFGTSAQVPAGNQFGAYESNEFIDIGLGMRPDLCGKGKGYEFLKKGLEFGREKYPEKKFRLTVAEFNKRAASLYEKVGFRKVMSFERISEQGNMVFTTMEL